MASADPENMSVCGCLNVQIRPQPVGDNHVDIRGNDSTYKSVFVGDEGVTITHPQLTLRTRSQGVQVPDTERCNRYVTLSCLLCQTIVYRVLQNIPMDIEGKEGPLLPTDDWAEQETLKSASGWIELHNGCLTGKAVQTARKSPSYSKIFSVVLPTPLSSSTESDSAPSYTPASPPVTSHTPSNHLPNLRPIFPPPPFTPSHPVFVHLSAIAASNSEALRKDAEEYLAELAKKKVAEVEKTESELRRHVEVLWRCFREGVEKVEQERRTRTTPTRSKDGSNWPGVEPASSKPSPALVSIRDFNPVSSPRRTTSPSFTPRMSSLSASLATSSFHHPKAQADQGRYSSSHEDSITSLSPPDLSDPSTSSSSKGYSSLSSRSSKSIRASMDGPTYLGPFRRNMDQTNDTATSFRYFTILEADAARTKRKAAGVQGNTGQDLAKKPSNEATEAAETSTTNGSTTERTNGSGSHSRKTRSNGHDKNTEEVNEVSPKGKRKVTFDIKPEIVTITRSVDKENKEDDSETARAASEDMIFDLEDEGSDRGIPVSNSLLPLNEPPHIPSKPPRTRVAGAGLPSSLSSLRPISLPAPSAVRPSRLTETPKDISQAGRATQSPGSSYQGHTKRTKPSSDTENPEPLDPREAEILKLVAADTPSHRGAWKKDSRAWQLFVSRQGGKGQSESLIPEETEDDTFGKFRDNESDGDGDRDSDPRRSSGLVPYRHADIAGSLPISIGPLSPTKEPLSLASYQPNPSLSNQPGVAVPTLRARSKSGSRPITSAAWRKAAYAQRDLSRYTDPGPLDFAADEDDDEDHEDEEESALASANKGGRGRQRALKILQIRSEVPASGMWRSLA